ncbi:MAG TPA: dTDP-4-dehydrorhamnose 3,5-epimerase [Patescibacteria group bacterium]|nr:dTDP-4-dehydrorhamnose 3,5-epimerase [Patescibacteria group bacterium]
MAIRIESEHLNGIKVIVPDVFKDERGFFMESFRADYFKDAGIPTEFLQENHSGSVQGVVRGLHFQYHEPMGKLIRATVGTVTLIEVDIRKNSPTLGEWVSIEISAENRRQVWIPPGFANGFCVLSNYAEIQYKCTAIYNPKGETGIRWNDPSLKIKWPVDNPILSAKDQSAQMLEEWLLKPEAEAFRL